MTEFTRMYGAVSGLKIDSKITITEEISIEPIYAHIMSPFIVAFKPAPKQSHHPGPWQSANGGTAWDSFSQIVINTDKPTLGFDQINTIWWLASLLRLQTCTSIRVPVVSNRPFSQPIDSGDDTFITAVEITRRNLLIKSAAAQDEKIQSLRWISRYCQNGASLMVNKNFNLAFQCFDSAHDAPSHGVAMTLIWTAMEVLFQPGKPNTTKTLARRISSYLNHTRSTRDKMFPEIKSLYEERGNVVHAAGQPMPDKVLRSWLVAKNCFEKTIELKKIPSGEDLDLIWSSK